MRLFLALFAACGLLASDKWPNFRGPGSMGIADDETIPEKWSATENVKWKTPIPGMGWSSPVVWGDRILVTSVVSSAVVEAPKKGLYFGGNREKPPVDEHRWMVYCVSMKTGKILWEKEVHKGVPAFSRHLKNSFASETPVTDGEMFYVYFGNIGLFAFDNAGKIKWERRFDTVKTRYGWGTASSPVLHKGRVYVVNDNDDKSWLLCLDKKTGKPIWQTDRDEKSNWSTPFIWENGSRTEVVTTGTGKVRSYDLDGKLIWEFGGMSTIVIPTPFTKDGLLYLTSGYVGDQNRPVYVIKPGAKGDITIPKGQTTGEFVQWYLPQAGPYNPSPLLYGGIYYTLLDRGFLTAHDAKTGKEIFGKQRIDEAAGAFTASPWASKGKIYAVSEDGDTFVFQAGPDYKLLGKNSLDEMVMSTPAIASGSLILRGASNLYRIAK